VDCGANRSTSLLFILSTSSSQVNELEMMMNRRNRDRSVSTCVQDAYGISDLGYPTGSGSYCCQSCYENASDSVFSGYHFGTETVDDDVSLAAGLCCSYDVVNLHVFAPPHHGFFSLHRDYIYHDYPCRGGDPVSPLYVRVSDPERESSCLVGTPEDPEKWLT
jgi:hypothetical protein